MATTTAPKVENPSKALAPDPSSQKQSAPSSSPTSPTQDETHPANKVNLTVVSGVDGENGGLLSDAQKKMRRAERFGMPVQLSEEEKRNSRAERFGMGGPASQGSKAVEQKMKARAERFGLANSAPADEVAKKKARLERFGLDTKTNSAEEDKRKARAIRFSQPRNSSLPDANVKTNTDQKIL